MEDTRGQAHQDSKDIGELITLIRIAIAQLDTKMDNFKDYGTKIDSLHEKQGRIDESSKSAHRRLDTHVRVGMILVGSFASAFIGAVFYFIQGGVQ